MVLFGLVVPEPLGGLGLGAASYSRVIQEIARYDGSTAVTVGAHSSIGMRGLLLFGTEEQRARYLPRLASGELIGAFALTEVLAGSDSFNLRTRAHREGNEWVLNGEKIWITNGGIADVVSVFARTQRGITGFVVETSSPGFSAGAPEKKMGIRGSHTAAISFDNVRVPQENMIGEEGSVGSWWR